MPINDFLQQRALRAMAQTDIQADAARASSEAGAWRANAARTPDRRLPPQPGLAAAVRGPLARTPAGALVRSEQSSAFTVESLGVGIEELAELLGGVETRSAISGAYLSDVLANGPAISLQTWLHALLYLGRVVAPACRDALMLGDLLRGRMLVAELLQAAPTVVECARAASMLSGGASDGVGLGRSSVAAPALRRALADERAVRCLAKLHADMGALAGWLARSSATDGLPPLPSLAEPSALGMAWEGAAAGPALAPRLTRPTPTPPPDTSLFTGAAPASHGTTKAALPSVWRPQLEDSPAPPTAKSEADEPWQDDPTAATALRKRRLFATLVACVLLALALAGAGRLWWNAQSAASTSATVSAAPTTQQDAGVASSAASPAAIPTEPTATEKVMPATPAPTSVPAAQAPAPSPTRAPTAVRAAPATAATTPTAGAATADAAVVPTVSSLAVACGAPGVALPLHNPSGTALAWSLVLPPGVVASGTQGMVNPGKTLTIFLQQTSGGPSSHAVLYVESGGRQTPVYLTLSGC
jgi:hypothetical protein